LWPYADICMMAIILSLLGGDARGQRGVNPHGEPISNSENAIAGFYGNECRGIVEPILVGEASMYFLMVYSNDQTLELTFKVWDSDQSEVVDLNQIVNFDIGDALGTVAEPYLFSQGNGPPLPYGLLSPVNGTYIQNVNHTEIEFSWETPIDPEGDPLTYALCARHGTSWNTAIQHVNNPQSLNIEEFPRDVWLEWYVLTSDVWAGLHPWIPLILKYPVR